MSAPAKTGRRVMYGLCGAGIDMTGGAGAV